MALLPFPKVQLSHGIQRLYTYCTVFADVADLEIDDGPRNPFAFAGYESDIPPAPTLRSRGVIAMDITEQFTNAAASTSCLGCVVRSRADILTRAGCRSARQGPVLYAFRISGSFGGS